VILAWRYLLLIISFLRLILLVYRHTNTKREEDNGWRKRSKETDMIDDKITFGNLDGVSELLLAFQLFDSGDGVHVRFFILLGNLSFMMT